MLSDAAEHFENVGLITGSIELGGGADYFDGYYGIQSSPIDGGGGDDVFRGGFGAETYIGGTGNDTIDGRDGIDTAIVSGRDRPIA